MADYHLSSILDKIIYQNEDNTVDQKAEIDEWLTKWVVAYECAEKSFDLPSETSNKPSLKLIHDEIKNKYGHSLYAYNETFIDILLRYIQEVYSINASSKHLKNCIAKLKILKENINLNSCYWSYAYEQPPNIEKSKITFEEYGRMLFKYHNEKKIPFIFQMGILNYFDYIILNKKENKEKKIFLKEVLLKDINFITQRSSDEKWLEFLHGDLVNVNSALCIHNTFCKNYNKHQNNMDVDDLFNWFAKYIIDIHENCIFNKFDIDNPYPKIFKYPGVVYYNKNKNIQSHNDHEYHTLILVTFKHLLTNNSGIDKVEYVINNLLPLLKQYLFDNDDSDGDSVISTSKSI